MDGLLDFSFYSQFLNLVWGLIFLTFSLTYLRLWRTFVLGFNLKDWINETKKFSPVSVACFMGLTNLGIFLGLAIVIS